MRASSAVTSKNSLRGLMRRAALARDLRGARDDVRVRWAQCVARVSLLEALGRASLRRGGGQKKP